MKVNFDPKLSLLSGGALPEEIIRQMEAAWAELFKRTCSGNDFLGWIDLPETPRETLDEIQRAAQSLRDNCDILIVAGIGGSYIGARSALEFIKTPYYNQLPKDTPDVYFAGTNLDGDALDDLLRVCEGKRVCVNLVSKSGTTTETAVAFRAFESLIGNSGENRAGRIICTCGEGPLAQYADSMGYRRFAVPDDVGGRYSVLSPAGLLPMAVAGIDIYKVIDGAKTARELYWKEHPDTPAVYAAYRHALMAGGRPVELVSVANPQLVSFGYWLQQLFAESEGKNSKGILPVPSAYTTDLHSLGQFVQQGSHILFETILAVDSGRSGLKVYPGGEFDKLSSLEGQKLDRLNSLAMQAVAEAHVSGGVPVLRLSVENRSEEAYGMLVFFFELACAVSSLMTGVNPFDQPGVEDYKRNMKRLFGEI